MINVDLLTRTLAHIEAHPETWDQGTWRCGTTACFAGHAIALSGIPFADADHRQEPDSVRGRDLPPAVAAALGAGPDDEIYAPIVAAELLGIPGHFDREDEGHLFESTNNLSTVRRIVAELCERAGADR